MSGSNGLPPNDSLLSSFLASAPVVLLCVGLACGVTACKGQREVWVRVSIPGADSLEAPASGVGVIALPYDRDSVRTVLEARASRHRPPTEQLDSQFARFRGPFTAYTNTVFAAGKLADTLGRLRAALDSTRPASPEYQTLHARYGRVADSLSALEARSERARIVLGRARSEFISRTESLRTAVRLWEDSTYQGYDSIVENLSKSRGMEPATDTTDATGWARFSLSPGQWWLFAHAWDTGDPNSEWNWNVPVQGDTVLLSSRTGRRRPRY
ncbi:MAG: hypothetical protein ACJ8BF_09015 [Gemmatimonadales bacterium]